VRLGSRKQGEGWTDRRPLEIVDVHVEPAKRRNHRDKQADRAKQSDRPENINIGRNIFGAAALRISATPRSSRPSSYGLYRMMQTPVHRTTVSRVLVGRISRLSNNSVARVSGPFRRLSGNR
jgi:hypothetical protein